MNQLTLFAIVGSKILKQHFYNSILTVLLANSVYARPMQHDKSQREKMGRAVCLAPCVQHAQKWL